MIRLYIYQISYLSDFILYQMKAAIKSGELASEFECVGIVNELRITPPIPNPENLDEKCRISRLWRT